MKQLMQMLVLALLVTGCERLTEQEALQESADALKDGYPRVAVEMAGKCLKMNNANWQALVLRGISRQMLQRNEDAIEDLEKAVLLSGDTFAPLYFLAWALAENGQYGDALKPLRAALKLKPSHPDALVLMAKCCLEQNLTEGVSCLQALRRYEVYRRDPALFNGLAYLWTMQGEHEKARQELLKAWACSPENPVVLHNLGILHDQYLREPGEAKRFYRYAISAAQNAGQVKREILIIDRLRQMVRESGLDDIRN